MRTNAMIETPLSLMKSGNQMCSAECLEQELENLNMPFRLCQVFTPSVQSVTPQQETMRLRELPQIVSEAVSQLEHVLRILQNRQPLAMLMRFHTIKPLQHLVTFDGQTTIFKIQIRQHGAPDGMGVEDGTCTSFFGNPNM